MPTPFTHLETAQRFLLDSALPAATRSALHADLGAFLLGNVAADARNVANSGQTREYTHFYDFDTDLEAAPPWHSMLAQFPELAAPKTPAHRAFVAGYVAHLAVDTAWSAHLVRTHILFGDWATRSLRFMYLGLILIHMDERDYARLEDWQYPALASAAPQAWLPFMPDAVLLDWGNSIAEQIKPDGQSQTYAIMGEKMHKHPDELRALMNDQAGLQDKLWAHLPLEELARVEATMYAHAVDCLQQYWALTATL